MVVVVTLIHPLSSGVTEIHRVDDRGVWCSDDDFHDRGGEVYVFRFVLVPWANIAEPQFIAAT